MITFLFFFPLISFPPQSMDGLEGSSWDGEMGLQEIAEMNANLLADLDRKEAEIQRLSKMIPPEERKLPPSDSLGSLSGLIDSKDQKDKKIIEIARKAKSLTVQLGKERSKAAQVFNGIRDLKKWNWRIFVQYILEG